MEIVWKRLLLPLLVILVLCQACSSADIGLESSGSVYQDAADSSGSSTLPDSTDAADSPGSSTLPDSPNSTGPSGTSGSSTSPDPAAPPSSPTNANQTPSIEGTPGIAEGQQPSSPSQGSGEPSANPTGGTAAPAETPRPGEPSEQNDKPSATPGSSEKPPASQGTAPPAQNPGVPAIPQDDGPIVLTIGGDGVDAETTWTLKQLQSLKDGYRELTYSTTNNWPSFGFSEARGISLRYLLKQSGIKDNAASIRFVSTDGYQIMLTYDQVFGTRYSYTSHSASGSSGAFAIEPLVAWAWGDAGKVRDENIRPFFGQAGPWDVNTVSFVKDLCRIEVRKASAGVWEAPGSSITDGSTVTAGSELELTHGSMDNIRIYYTLDGSEPDYNSPVYNQSASYFQPKLIKPLVLTESVTIKAFAAGMGKEKSAVITLNIRVS